MNNRIPKDFFITKGSGLSDITMHAGAFHFALWDAGIDGYNFVKYSSVLHKKAECVNIESIKSMPEHGSEMMCIQAIAEGKGGETISAGIIYGYLYDLEGNCYGGIVCEESNTYGESQLTYKLINIIDDMYCKTYKTKGLILRDVKTITEELSIPNDVRFGCCLVSLCFINYL